MRQLPLPLDAHAPLDEQARRRAVGGCAMRLGVLHMRTMVMGHVWVVVCVCPVKDLFTCIGML